MNINIKHIDGHISEWKKSHEIIAGPEFDSFPEFYHLPLRHANIPWFGSKFHLKSAKNKHLLSTWSEEEDSGHSYLSSNNDPNSLNESFIWSIEPGFHKNSVVIKDYLDRKLGVDRVNDSFNNMDIILMKTVTHIATYSWFIYTNKYGHDNGYIFESMKHQYILSIDDKGRPYIIHKSLFHPDCDGWKFENIIYSDYDHHHKLLKNATKKWHDNVVNV